MLKRLTAIVCAVLFGLAAVAGLACGQNSGTGNGNGNGDDTQEQTENQENGEETQNNEEENAGDNEESSRFRNRRILDDAMMAELQQEDQEFMSNFVVRPDDHS